MKESIVIYGPEGCGKTKMVLEFLGYFNLSFWAELESYSGEISKEHVLYLTNSEDVAKKTGLKTLGFFEAVAEMKGLA